MTEHYEIMYIVPIHAEEDQLVPVMETVVGLIKENGGEINKDKNLGNQNWLIQ